MIPTLDGNDAETTPEPALEQATAGRNAARVEERTEDATAPDCPAVPVAPGRPIAPVRLASPVRASRRVARVAALGVLLAVLGFIVVVARAPSALQLQAQSPEVGKTAPLLVGTTITGAPFSLADLRGHFVYVDFFASWCAACQESQPYLDIFVREHARRGGARLVGVIFGDAVRNVFQFLGPEVGKYPVVPDSSGMIAFHWGVGNPAEIYLVDPRGEVIAKIDGAVTTKGLDWLLSRDRLAGVTGAARRGS